jgi:hypothetical protein
MSCKNFDRSIALFSPQFNKSLSILALLLILLEASIAHAQDEFPVLINTQVIKAQSPIANDWFGTGLAIDGDTAIINAVGYESGGRRVLLFNWESHQWNYYKPVGPEILSEDGSGPVALNDDILLVSESNHDGTDACTPDEICGHSGQVFVFERNLGGENNWGLRATLNGGHKPSASFGSDVQLNGDTIAIAAYSEDLDSGGATNRLESGTQYIENAGAVYIFERNEGGENQWGLSQRLEAPNPTASTYFGSKLQLAGDQLVLVWGDGHTENTLLIYEPGAGSNGGWGPVQELEIPPSRCTNTSFDGATIVVTTFSDETKLTRFHFFERGESGEFVLHQTTELENGSFCPRPTVDHGQMIARAPQPDVPFKARLFVKNIITGEWEIVAVLDFEDGQFSDGFIGLTLDSGRALVSIESESNDYEGDVFAFELAPAVNAGHMGGWFNPHTPGQGQLVDVDETNDFLFGAWFTYTLETSNHPYEQHWFTAQGRYAGNKADLVLYETLGGRFDDPALVETAPVGTASISFTDCASGMMQYEIDMLGVSGAFPLTRLIPGSETTCMSRQDQLPKTADINPGMNGGWLNYQTPGQGFLVDAYPDGAGGGFLFVAWFTFGESSDSGQRWLTAQGNFSGLTAEIDVYEATGGIFDASLPPQNPRVGSMTVDFTDCDAATLFYDLDEGVAGDIPLIRLLPAANELCQEFMRED